MANAGRALSQAGNSKNNEPESSELLMVLPRTEKAWWKTSHLLQLNSFAAALLLFSSTIGYDGSLMTGLQSLTPWMRFMDEPSGAWLGFISAIQALGSMVGLPTQAWALNKFGRKPCILFGYIPLAIGVGLQGGARNPAMFIASRFIIGYAGAWFQAAVILLTEIAYPTHRSRLTAMYQCQYYIGAVLSAWLVFACRNIEANWAWRIPSLCQILFPFMALPMVIFCPESPRWLIRQDRTEEAKDFFTQFHAGGDTSSPLISLQMTEMNDSIRLDIENSQSSSWADIFKSKTNRHRTFISITLGIFAQWNGVGVVSYYLTLILKTIGITSVTQQTFINAFLQLWNLIMAIIGSLLVDKAGRRMLFLLSTCIMLVSYIIITSLSGIFASQHTSSVGTAVIPFLFLYYGGYDIAFTPLLMSYPAEIWPYTTRAKGVALTSISTYIALLFNQFVNPIALVSIAWKYYIVYVCLLVVIFVVVYLFYPETRGYTLEEIAMIFEENVISEAPESRGSTNHAKGQTMHLESLADSK